MHTPTPISSPVLRAADNKDQRDPTKNHATFEDYRLMKPYTLTLPLRQYKDNDQKVRVGAAGRHAGDKGVFVKGSETIRNPRRELELVEMFLNTAKKNGIEVGEKQM